MWLQHDSRDRNEMTKIGFHLENIQSRFNHERVERVCIEAFAFLLLSFRQFHSSSTMSISPNK